MSLSHCVASPASGNPEERCGHGFELRLGGERINSGLGSPSFGRCSEAILQFLSTTEAGRIVGKVDDQRGASEREREESAVAGEE